MQNRIEEIEREPQGRKARREKDSSRAVQRGFRDGASIYASRLSKPGYVAACHSKKPEAMAKVVAGAPRGFRIRQLLHYIARSGEGQPENSVWLADHDGQLFTDKAEVEALARTWGDEFRPEFRQIRELRAERKQLLARGDTVDLDNLNARLAKLEEKLKNDGQGNRKSRDVMHLVLSAKAGNTPQNQARVLAAAVQTASKYFRNHEYVIGLHQDARHPHVHLVVKCAPRAHSAMQGARKLRLNRPELLMLRTTWARELTRQGLEHVATLRRDRPHIASQVATGKEPLQTKPKNWYAASIKGLAENMEFLSKRREDLAAAMERTADHQEAMRIRKEIGGRLNDIRAMLRAQTEKGDKQRLIAFAELRRIERELKRSTDPKLRFLELAGKSGPHKPVYEYTLKSIALGKRLTSDASFPGAQERKKSITAHQTSMAAAWTALREGGLTREEYAVAAKVLDIHDQAMRKAFGLAPAVPEPKHAPSPAKSPTRTKDEGLEL